LIDFSHNKIGEEGIIALVAAIKQNTTVELICLEGIDIAEKTAAILVNISSKVWEG